MANFCAKCGAEISEDSPSCSACGAPTAVGVRTAAPAQLGAAPAKSGSSTVKIILIVVGVFVLLGILGAGIFGFAVWRVARAVHGSGVDGQVTLNTPGGTMTVNSSEKISASELGTDVYPGAQPGKQSLRMKLSSGSMVSAEFITSDSKEQVVNFYKSKLGGEANSVDTGSAAVFTSNKGKDESLVITVTTKSTERDGKTHIHIVHSTNNTPS